MHILVAHFNENRNTVSDTGILHSESVSEKTSGQADHMHIQGSGHPHKCLLLFWLIRPRMRLDWICVSKK